MTRTATLIKNNQPRPISLPTPFRGALPPGGTFITGFGPDRAQWHLQVGGAPVRDFVLTQMELQDAEREEQDLVGGHSPPIDEWFGAVVTSDASPRRIEFRGPGRGIFLAANAAYLLRAQILAKQAGGGYAAFNYQVSAETDDTKIITPVDMAPLAPDVNKPGYAITWSEAGLQLQLDVTGLSAQRICWAVHVQALLVEV